MFLKHYDKNMQCLNLKNSDLAKELDDGKSLPYDDHCF